MSLLGRFRPRFTRGVSRLQQLSVPASAFAADFANDQSGNVVLQSLKNTTSAAFIMGAFDISVAFWIKLHSVPAGNTYAFSLWDANVAANRVFGAFLRNVTGAGQMAFQIQGASATVRRATVTTNINDGAWHLFIGQWDHTNGLSSAQIDNGTIVTAAAAAITMTAIGPSTVPLRCGANDVSGAAQGWLDASLDSVGFWKRAPGAAVILDGTLQTALFNSGAGRNFANLTAGLKTSLLSWWDCEEATGSPRLDAQGTTTLSDDGVGAGHLVTQVVGKV